MLSSRAFQILESKGIDAISFQDAESFFRVDDYVTGIARSRKLARIIDAFGDDPLLGNAIKRLADKVRKI